MQRWKEYLEKTEVKHHPRGQDQWPANSTNMGLWLL
jgi:hypothetical protein